MDPCGTHAPNWIYSEVVGLSTAEVYQENGLYFLYLVGDQVACLLGTSDSLEECLDEIEGVRELAESVGMLR